jgi:hypothetical protein
MTCGRLARTREQFDNEGLGGTEEVLLVGSTLEVV